jgi:hypothetical protein
MMDNIFVFGGIGLVVILIFLPLNQWWDRRQQ